jgi:hypothetical protein
MKLLGIPFIRIEKLLEVSKMKTVSIALLVLCGCAIFASAADPTPAPEIDPGSAVAVMGLVGSTLIMALRRAKK